MSHQPESLGAVQVLLLSPEHGILLQKRGAEKIIAPDRWSLLGAEILPDETPPESALREIFQTTGLKFTFNDIKFVSIAPCSWEPGHLFIAHTFYVVIENPSKILKIASPDLMFVQPRIFEEIDVVGYSREQKRAMLMMIFAAEGWISAPNNQ